MPDPSPSTLTVLNSNFLQLIRSGGRPQWTVYPRWLPVNTVIHTTLAGIEPTTFRLLVGRATSSATDSPNALPLVSVLLVLSSLQLFYCCASRDIHHETNVTLCVYCGALSRSVDFMMITSQVVESKVNRHVRIWSSQATVSRQHRDQC